MKVFCFRKKVVQLVFALLDLLGLRTWLRVCLPAEAACLLLECQQIRSVRVSDWPALPFRVSRVAVPRHASLCRARRAWIVENSARAV